MTTPKPSESAALSVPSGPTRSAGDSADDDADEEGTSESAFSEEARSAITRALSDNLAKLRKGQRAAVLIIGLALLALLGIAGAVVARYAAADAVPVVLVIILVPSLVAGVGLILLARTHRSESIRAAVVDSVAETAAQIGRRHSIWNQPLLDVDLCREPVMSALQEIHGTVSSALRLRWKVGDEHNVRAFAFFAVRSGSFQDPAWLVLSHFGCHVGTDLAPNARDANLRIPFRHGVVGAAFCHPSGVQNGNRAFGLDATVLPFVRNDVQFVCAKAFKHDGDVLCVIGLDFAGLGVELDRVGQIAEAEAALAWSCVMPEVRPELQQSLVAAIEKRIVVTEEAA